MNNKELFYFLGKCLAMVENQEKNLEVIKIISQKKVDWDRFVYIASDYLVQPAVYLRFRSNGIIPYLPEELTDHLRMIYELNLKRNQAVLGQIDRINRLLATAGIVPIYLKGAGNLLDHLYEDTGERMFGDIDFLVSDDEFLQAANLLKSVGYEHLMPFYEDDQSITKHYPRLVHLTEPIDVEVHRVPVELQFAANLNYAVIRSETKQIETDPPCLVLSDRHNVILNFIHGFMAEEIRLKQMVSFRNMVDLYLLSHRVDIFEALAGQPHYTSKAVVYANFMFHVMDVPIIHTAGLRSRFFIKKHELLLKSPSFFYLAWLLNFVLFRIWTKYLLQTVGAFHNVHIRRSLFRKLGEANWYKRHLKYYSDSFNRV